VAIGAHDKEISRESGSLRQKKATHLFSASAGRQAAYSYLRAAPRQMARDIRPRFLAVTRRMALMVDHQDLDRLGLGKQRLGIRHRRMDSRLAFHPTTTRRTRDTALRGGNTMIGRPELKTRDSARLEGRPFGAQAPVGQSPPGPRSTHARRPRCSGRATTPLRLRADSVAPDYVLEQGTMVRLDLLELCSVHLAHALHALAAGEGLGRGDCGLGLHEYADQACALLGGEYAGELQDAWPLGAPIDEDDDFPEPSTALAWAQGGRLRQRRRC